MEKKENTKNNLYNGSYWNDFYKSNANFIEQESSFAIFTLDYLKKYPEHKNLIDIGCGNGRDLKYFIMNNYFGTGIDNSHEVCEYLRMQNLNIILDSFITYNYTEYDIFYSRFSLHSISYPDIKNFISNISNCMSYKSLFFIETRSIKGTEYEHLDYIELDFKGGIGEIHKRTLLNKTHLTELLKSANLIVEYESDTNGISVYKGEDPYIIRLVVRKK